ncbi:MAG TPA: serine hydrolase domain-containing protein [Pseudonocardiaceae bacterium]|jgi:CubicO group peptidase (beta-lactamase class C family)|nr:serine hydrolase domain-containing protein [Pseudonocardiaceae bacterium]
MDSLRGVRQWPVDTVAVAVVDASGAVVGSQGPQDQPFRLTSVTKLLSAYAVLLAVQEGAVEWHQPTGPPGATVRHLLAHASGLTFDTQRVSAPPETKRIYSNTGFVVVADAVASSSGIRFADYLAEGVFRPLGMSSSRLAGSAAAGVVSTCADLARFAAELQAPTLLAPQILAEATRVAYPGLDGMLPGYGMQRPNDWGLGFELRDHKSPHWTGSRNSPETFGHFGRSGTFLWVDPVASAACIALTDRDFGPWARDAWPPLSDAVLAELVGG